jgi:hypothetical protein
MNLPVLPSNPMTITPPVKMVPPADGVWVKFAGRSLDAKFFNDVRAELQNLRDWDNYERHISEGREAAKRVLRRFLDQEQ